MIAVGAAGEVVGVLMITVGGVRPSEFRDRLIGSALDTYTYQGWLIPGRSRGPVASLILWLLRYEGPDAPRLRPPGLRTI